MITRIEDTTKVADIFGDWQETLIWSCLQGVMGNIYVDNEENPESAMAILGDFCYVAGKVNKELCLYKPVECDRDFIIMVPLSRDWEELISETYGKKSRKVTRYATKKERGIFDKEYLQEIVETLHPEYSLQLIDENVYNYCKSNDWTIDLVHQYPEYEMYEKLGLGVVVMKDGEPISGASSYSTYEDGIEIEIQTKEEYRRQGFASVCGARLILECMKRNMYASWDAQNKWSLSLSEKLGYHFDGEYVAFEIEGY